MKFDMTRAWNEAMAIFGANASLMSVIAGLFVFLPNLAVTMLAPEISEPPAMTGDETPEQMMEVMSAFYATAAPWIIAISIISLIGSLAMYALTSASRPTVGDALKTGFAAFIPALLAQIILVVGMTLLAGLLIGIPAGLGIVALVVIMTLVVIVGLIYLTVKFSLISPVIVLEGVRNPLTALKRSWKLTKGNSIRLFGYYLILLVVVIVVSLVFGLFSQVFVALLGDGTAGLLLAGILSGILAVAFAVLAVCIFAAVHRQLAGPVPETVSETFE